MSITYFANDLERLRNAVNRRKAMGWHPRVHGNGFIQLDLALDEHSEYPGDVRLHVWGDPRIPRQKVASTIHDHIFTFQSEIVIGKLVNVKYAVYTETKTGNYKVYEPFVREGQDTGLADTKRVVFAKPSGFELIAAELGYNTTYSMKAGEYHETMADRPAATIMSKVGPSQVEAANAGLPVAKPHVLVPVGREPNNDFKRNGFDESLLWEIIYDTLDGA